MARKINTSLSTKCSGLSQQGAALILMAFILGLGAAAYLLKTMNLVNMQESQDKKASLILAMAKEAVIGYSVSRVNGGTRPGDMPLPDRLLTPTESPPTGGAPNYDGVTDSCVTSGTGLSTMMHCLGRLPWQTLGMTNLNPSQNDGLGNMPWYAVSANLVDPTCMKVINPSILNMVYTNYQCNSGTNLPHPWLTIQDGLGNVISNRVAVVLLLPRPPIGVQSRPESPLADISNYLETGNNELDNVFVLSVATSTMNDRLVYITIDELMEAVGRRAFSDASILLNQYKYKNTYFPNAAPLGSALNNHISGAGTKGMLPIDVTDSCSCTSTTSCSCSFNPITTVAFTRGSGSVWTSNTGSCLGSGATCSCTGAGSCTRTTRTFSCNGSGLCTHNVTGSNKYTYSVPNYADVNSPTAGCIISSNQAVCNGAGSFSIGLLEPSWFKANLWQDYLYYGWSVAPNLQLGGKGSLSAILINAGNATTSETSWIQNRPLSPISPSSDIRDYLDSIENTNNDNIFEASNKQKSSSYNDQPFVVAP